jgi:hypothetical protein
MGAGNAVEFSQVTLRLVPEILDPINVILPVREQCTMVYRVVLEVANIQHVVTHKGTGILNTVRPDHFLQYS